MASETKAVKFTRVNGCGGHQRWIRNDKPEIFVTHYPALRGVRQGLFYVFRAVAKVPAGRCPWTVDNRRISPEQAGRSTVHCLRDALLIAEAA